ncbi:MAG: hypothetical protein ACR2N5_06365 [Solirubrobacterales bacterium]
MRRVLRNPILRLLLLVAPAVIAVGCGGDDDAEITPVEAQTDAVPTITKRELIERGDAICAEANAAIANLSASGTTDPLTLVSQERAITEGMLGSLQSLGTPEQNPGPLNRYYNAVSNEIAILDRQQTALERSDTASFTAFGAELTTARSDALLAAQEYGFLSCGQEGTTITPTTPTDGVPVAPETPAAPPPPTDGGGTGGGGGGGSSGGVGPG